MDRIRFSPKMLLPKYWLVWLGMGLWWLFVQLFPFRVLMFLGAMLGRFVGLLSKRRRMIAQKNIDLCFPELSEPERKGLMWKTLESTGRGFFDTGIAWFWPRWRLRRLIHVEGMELVNEAFERGEGVVLFFYHFTCLEMAIAAFTGQYLHPLNGVYRPHANPVYDLIMRLGRERHGRASKAIPRTDVRGMVRTLRKGELLLYLPDQDYGHKYSTFVPFMGVEAATVSAPTQLVRMSKAKVFSFTGFRFNDGYRFRVYPELENYSAEGEQADARAMNEFLEERIREHPEQYLWVHRRFKSRPDHAKDFYGLEALRSFRRRQKRRSKAWAKRQANEK